MKVHMINYRNITNLVLLASLILVTFSSVFASTDCRSCTAHGVRFEKNTKSCCHAETPGLNIKAVAVCGDKDENTPIIESYTLKFARSNNFKEIIDSGDSRVSVNDNNYWNKKTDSSTDSPLNIIKAPIYLLDSISLT